jgi:hypothetical protein
MRRHPLPFHSHPERCPVDVHWIRSGFPIKFALRKIDLFTAAAAFMGFVKFVRENLFLRTAMGASADKRLQVLVVFKARAMLWCGHKPLLDLIKIGPAWQLNVNACRA